jgi:diaminopimelate epimerase
MFLPSGFVLIGYAEGLCKLQAATPNVHPENVQFDYLKMQGAGNRIVVVDNRARSVSPPDKAALLRLANAEAGPGFDQLMWLIEPQDRTCDAAYRVFNADGSEVEQCGNGVRCVASMLARESGGQTDFRLESPAGIVLAKVSAPGRVTVSMGAPVFEPADIPFIAESMSDRYLLDVDGEEFDVAVVSMGNPHCVLQVADVQSADVPRLGPLIEHHERFPQRTNAGFMAVTGRDSIDLRVHERGVGETLACGTGACAAVVTGQRLGHLDHEVTVSLPGGQLMVSWRGGTETAWLSGDAEFISEGTIDI